MAAFASSRCHPGLRWSEEAMARKRPCRICRRWFRADPRVGPRQRTCGAPSCRRDWHRKSCRAWRRRNPDYDRDDRLRRRLLGSSAREARGGDPLARLNWGAARDAIGLQAAVVIEETGRVLVSWAQDAMALQRPGFPQPFGRQLPQRVRDAMGSPPSGP
jgi:hypothetical protein